MDRLAVRIEHGNLDPAEVEAVAGGPDHRTDAVGADIKLPQRFGDAARIRQHRAGGRIFRHVQGVTFDMGIRHVEEAA